MARRTCPIDIRIGARLRELRMLRGWTQQTLAEQLGCSYQQAHKYEKAVNRISAARLLHVLRLLRADPAEFFAAVDDGQPTAPAIDRTTLHLMQDIAALSPKHRKAVARMVRLLVDSPDSEAA